MNYNSDKPIENSEQDLLGRITFSKQLGEAINSYDGKDGLVLGLFGKWGTGKTSILNMVVNEINQLSKNEDNRPIIVNFSPWNYTDKDNLISLFFRVLKNKLDLDKDEEKRKKIGKALTDYSDALDALSLVPMVGSGLAAILKTIAKAQGAELSKDVDIDTTKKHLEKVLDETNQKIIVIIDDIDRLTNTQIRDIFQLVKQVGNFPNIIYVLSMDRDVVCRALESVHNINGTEYLEKIVQIPFEIPALLNSRLREIFLTNLMNTVETISENPKIEQSYWSEVFINCIEPHINTLRDINRVINTFQFRYKILQEETAFEDMVALTTIEVLEPKLYQWIGKNKDLLLGTYSHNFSALFRDKADYRKSICEELKKLGINTDIGIKFLATLFPVFAKDIDERDYRYTKSNIRETMRVAQEERFNSYFLFDLEEIPIPRYIINNCINTLNLDELINVVSKINDAGNIEYFIDELRSLVDKIPNKRLGLLSSVILKTLHKFSQNSQFFMLSAYTKAEFLVYDIMSKIYDENERYNLIKSILENINKEQLGTIANFINRIELAYGRLAGNEENKSEQLITLEHLEYIEKIYAFKINKLSKSEIIFEISQFYMAFYLWECFDKKEARSHLEKMLYEDINILKFICAVASKWSTDHDDSGWYFLLDRFSTYISKEKIYKTIIGYDRSNLGKFSLDDQIKLATFILTYDKVENYRVSEREALNLVKEWKCGAVYI